MDCEQDGIVYTFGIAVCFENSNTHEIINNVGMSEQFDNFDKFALIA